MRTAFCSWKQYCSLLIYSLYLCNDIHKSEIVRRAFLLLCSYETRTKFLLAYLMSVLFSSLSSQLLSCPVRRWLLSSFQSHKSCGGDFGLTRASNKECPLWPTARGFFFHSLNQRNYDRQQKRTLSALHTVNNATAQHSSYRLRQPSQTISYLI